MNDRTSVADILQAMYDTGDSGTVVERDGRWYPAGVKQYQDDLKNYAMVLADMLGVPVANYTEED